MRTASADGAVAALAASQHGAYSRRQAASKGYSRRMIAFRLEHGLVREPIPGVLVDAVPSSWRQRLMIATLVRPEGVASHRAAAALHRLDGFDEADLDISVRSTSRRLVPEVVVHRTAVLPPSDVVVVDGIRCTNIARTLCDLGAVVSDERVEQALDDALRREISQRWIRETLERVARPGPSGTATLHRVLARADRSGPLPDSMFERLVERLLVTALPRPVRQWWVAEVGGDRRARLDLAWPDLKLAVEPVGERFHRDPQRGRRDADRRAWLERQGWELIDVLWSDLDDPDALVARVLEAFTRRSAQLGVQRAL